MNYMDFQITASDIGSNMARDTDLAVAILNEYCYHMDGNYDKYDKIAERLCANTPYEEEYEHIVEFFEIVTKRFKEMGN